MGDVKQQWTLRRWDTNGPWDPVQEGDHIPQGRSGRREAPGPRNYAASEYYPPRHHDTESNMSGCTTSHHEYTATPATEYSILDKPLSLPRPVQSSPVIPRHVVLAPPNQPYLKSLAITDHGDGVYQNPYVEPATVNPWSAGATHGSDGCLGPYHYQEDNRLTQTQMESQLRQMDGCLQTRVSANDCLRPHGGGVKKLRHDTQRRNGGRRTNAKWQGKAHGKPAGIFFCELAFAGCRKRFSAKNEWKRHEQLQHFQTKIWKCDLPSCNGKSIFNRKDLFGQHLRRMHAPCQHRANGDIPRNRQACSDSSNCPEMQDFISTEIPKIQERCCIAESELPQTSSCGFCGVVFQGAGTWEERMEHVGRHFESAANVGEDVSLEAWKIDSDWLNYALENRLINQGADGGYTLGKVGKEKVTSCRR